MTKQQKQEKIFGAIAARGWFTAEIFWDECRELELAGKLKRSDRYSLGGNRKVVWVAA
jgi:hypothetical protein